jgi:cysteine sulfinate desulfinase/cysteine desulfurase-like protein
MKNPGYRLSRKRFSSALVTIMHANRETGTIQPIREIAAAAHKRSAQRHDQ